MLCFGFIMHHCISRLSTKNCRQKQHKYQSILQIDSRWKTSIYSQFGGRLCNGDIQSCACIDATHDLYGVNNATRSSWKHSQIHIVFSTNLNVVSIFVNAYHSINHWIILIGMFGIPLNIRFLSSSEFMNTIVQAFSQWLCSLYLSVYIRAGEVTQRISHNTSMVSD